MQNKEYDYLDLLGKGLDPYQEAACCRTENTIIAAGAGSGKTQVLASRFAWLVMSKGVPAKKILTLTFTNKAAAEMYYRIYKSLSELAQNPKTPPKEKERAAKAIEEFSEVHIQTLDSYCKSIVSQAANRYGISPDFSVDSGSTDFSLKALQFVLKNRDNPAILHFLGNKNLQTFATTYFSKPIQKYTSVADSKTRFFDDFTKQSEEVVKVWNDKIKEFNKLPGNIFELLPEAKEETPATFAIREFVDTAPDFYPISSLSDFENKELMENINLAIDWLYELNTIKLNAKKKSEKGLKNYILELLNGTTFGLFGFIQEYAFIKEFVKLLDDFSNQIQDEKRSSNALSFSDVTNMAIKILQEQEDILVQEQNAYDKIMIDEFQDNNEMNRDLLFLISQGKDGKLNPEKLFFVGDEKQSIYKFRGADVSVFNELKNDLNTTPLQMIYNYRSNNSLLTSFNKIFSNQTEDGSSALHKAIFDSTSDNSFEATFPKKAHAKKSIIDDDGKRKELPAEELTQKNVNAHIYMLNTESIENKTELLSKENQEAYFIAKKIKDIYDSTPKEKRKYSHFACLDKTRTNRRYLKNWLNHFEIPYSLDAQGDLFSEAPVNDIFSFFRLCVYPSDVLAFAAFLRSPLACLSQKSVNTILAILKKENDNLCFNESLSQKIKEIINESEYKNYENAKEFFVANRDLVLSQNITKSLTMLWYKTGYYYESLQNLKVNLLAEQYDLLFELARQCDSNGQSVAFFVDSLAQIREKEKVSFKNNSDEDLDIKDILYPVEKPDAVQIMTIHKSKGLQFKHVFVSGCMGSPKAAESEAFYDSKDFGISIKPGNEKNYFFEINRELENQKNLAEFKRLVYVAATRAEDDFYFVGSWEKTKKFNPDNLPLMQGIVDSYYENAINLEENLQGVLQFNEDAPFDFTSIKPVTTKMAYEKKEIQIPSDFYSNLFENYNRIETIKTDIPESNRKSPSDFGKEYYEEHKSKFNKTETSEQKSEKYFDTSSASANSEISDESENDSTFQKKDYGTIAHAFLESYANGIDIQTYSTPKKMFKDLSEENIEKIKNECRDFCSLFENSQIGKLFLDCKYSGNFFKAEYSFRLFHEKIIYTGSIDLIFQNKDGTYVIVDYKTDEEIEPEVHKKQQELYKIAASKLLKCKPEQIECYLFYLLHNKEVKLDL